MKLVTKVITKHFNFDIFIVSLDTHTNSLCGDLNEEVHSAIQDGLDQIRLNLTSIEVMKFGREK